jgi:hypothetical protein
MAETIIDVTDTFDVNTIIWLRSLPDDELGPSGRMAEDVETLARASGPFPFEEIVVTSSKEMLAALSDLAERCRGGLRPILHFDCHGSEDGGLLLAPSGEYVGWQELADALRAVNVAAENNVCCIFGVCFGLHLTSTLSITEPTPYFLTIAPEGEIAVGELEARLPRFYDYMLRSGSITDAYDAELKLVMGIFKCQAVFGKVVATYINNHARGAALVARKEALITDALDQNGVAAPTPEQLRQIRAPVKDGLKLDQATIDCFASVFLIGRKAAIDLQDAYAIAEALSKDGKVQ